MVKQAPCTLACTATLAESKPKAFWLKNKKYCFFNFEFPKAQKKPLDLLHSNVRGRAVKKRRGSILMPRLLRFTFCFLLFVAQLAPSLPFSFAAPFPDPRYPRQTIQLRLDRPDSSDQTGLDRPDSSA